MGRGAPTLRSSFEGCNLIDSRDGIFLRTSDDMTPLFKTCFREVASCRSYPAYHSEP